MQDQRHIQVQAEPRPLSRGSRPISVKSSSTHHKRTHSPKAISSISQKSNALSEHHFREGDVLLREHDIPHCYESYRQGFKALKLQQGHTTAGFESRFTSRCAILLTQAQKYLDDKQSESAKEVSEAVLALCEEFSDIVQTSIPITSSFLKSQVGHHLGQPVMYAPVRFNALNKLGLCERQLANFQQGLDYLLSAIDIGQQHGLNVGETWVNLAAVYMSMKNWRKGRHAAQEAVKSLGLENESPYPKKIARLLAIASYNSGKCNEKLNDLQEAIDDYRSGIKILKTAGIDPQEQVYKSISYAFLQAMKDFKDGAVKRKTFGDMVETGISEPKGSEKNSDQVAPNTYKISKSGQIRRPGTAMSAAHSKELEHKGFRSPMSNHTNPLSKSINLVNKSETRGQLFSSLQKSHEVISDNGIKDSESRGFFNTVSGQAVVRVDSSMKNGPVKSPWVIRSKQSGMVNGNGKPPIGPNSNLHGGMGILRERNTAPSTVHEFRVGNQTQYERKTHQGTYSGEGGWKESDSAIGVEESWDELAGQQDAAEKSKSYSKLGPRRSLAAREVMRENRLQLAMELKDINQKLIGMDLVPLRLPKQRNGSDDPNHPATQPVLSGGARIGETSSFRLKKGYTDGISPGLPISKPPTTSKKALIVLRKQNSQSGRISQGSGVQSAEMMTPPGNPPAKIQVSVKPQNPSATAPSKPSIKRIGSLSEPSPKHSVCMPVNPDQPPKQAPTRQEAAAAIQQKWKRDKLGVERVKRIVRKRFLASTFVCTHYLKVPKMVQVGDQQKPEGSSLPAKILVFLHKDSFLLVSFVLPSFIPGFSLIPKTFNVLGHPEKLRLIGDENRLYFESVIPEPVAPKLPKTLSIGPRSQIGEETIRPLFHEEESADQTPGHLRRPLNIPNRDLSQDDDLLQPLIPVSASGRGSQRDVEPSAPQEDPEAEIQRLKEEILDEYLQDGVDLMNPEAPKSQKTGTKAPEPEQKHQKQESDRKTAAKQQEQEQEAKKQQEEALAAQEKTRKAEIDRIAKEEAERAERVRIQVEDAEKLRKEQDLLKEQLRVLQEEKIRQEQEILRKKAEAEAFIKEQERIAAELLKKQEEEARVKAEELKKKVDQDMLKQKQEEEARLLKIREDFIQKQKLEEEQYQSELAKKKLLREQEEQKKEQDAIFKQQEEERLAQEAKLQAQAKIEAEEKVSVQNYKQGIALALMKKGQIELQKPAEKSAVITKRYGDVTALSEAEKHKAEAEAAGFIQDFLKFNKISKQALRKEKVFLGSTKIDLPENQYLLEAHRLSENPLQPETLDEVVISGMGIIRLCVLKELRLNSISKLSLGSDLSPKFLKIKVIDFMRGCLTIKASSEIQYVDGYLGSDEAQGGLRSSTQTAHFGQIELEQVTEPVQSKTSNTTTPSKIANTPSLHGQISPGTSGETPTHQSLDLVSAPLVQNPVAAEGSPKTPPKTSARFGATKPPMITITPAPVVEEAMAPSSSRELFSFTFYGSNCAVCKVVYKEPSPSTPIVEFYSTEGEFRGYKVCPVKISRKEELGRLLRWIPEEKVPQIDISKSPKYSGDAAVESAGFF